MDITGYVEAMRRADQENAAVILPRYADILPRNRFGEPAYRKKEAH